MRSSSQSGAPRCAGLRRAEGQHQKVQLRGSPPARIYRHLPGGPVRPRAPAAFLPSPPAPSHRSNRSRRCGSKPLYAQSVYRITQCVNRAEPSIAGRRKECAVLKPPPAAGRAQMLHIARCRRAQGLALRLTADADGVVRPPPFAAAASAAAALLHRCFLAALFRSVVHHTHARLLHAAAPHHSSTTASASCQAACIGALRCFTVGASGWRTRKPLSSSGAQP